MGILTRQGPQGWHPAPEQIKAAGREAAAFCERHGTDLAHLAIQFALQNSVSDVTLLGTRNVDELENALRIANTPGDEKVLAGVRELLGPVKCYSWESGTQ